MKPLRLHFPAAFLVWGFILLSFNNTAAQRRESPPVAPPKPPTGSVKVRVAYADTRRPVRFATVTLLRLDVKMDNYDRYNPTELGPAAHSSADTDLQGHAAFPKVPPGRYAAFVNGVDLLNLRYHFTGQNNPLTKTPLREELFHGWFPAFTVKANETEEVEVSARRGGVIAGQVTGADNNPVPDAVVTLLRREAGGKLFNIRLENSLDRADTQGNYRLYGLPPGEYLVRAAPPVLGLQDARENVARSEGYFLYGYHPTGRSAQTARAVSVQEGVESPNTDILLPELPLRGLGGKVTANGQPLTGSEILITLQDPDLAQPIAVYETQTDEKGRWLARGLPSGKYLLSIVVTDNTVILQGDKVEAANALSAEREIVLGDTDQTALDIKLKAGLQVSGEFVKPEKSDKDDSYYFRLALAEIADPPETQGGEDYDESNLHFSSRSDAQFSISQLKPGRYLWNFLDNRGTTYVQKILWQNKDLAREPLELKEDAELSGVKVILADDFATVSGLVSADEAQRRPADLGIVLFKRLDAPAGLAAQQFQFSYVEDNGEFSQRLPPGEYRVLAVTGAPQSERQWSAKARVTFKKHEARALRLTLKGNETREKLRLTAVKAVAPEKKDAP
jgi:hypothetical protein